MKDRYHTRRMPWDQIQHMVQCFASCSEEAQSHGRFNTPRVNEMLYIQHADLGHVEDQVQEQLFVKLAACAGCEVHAQVVLQIHMRASLHHAQLQHLMKRP